MKKLLAFTAILISLTSFGQNWKKWKSTDDIRVRDLIEFKYLNDSIRVDNFYWLAIIPQLGTRTKYCQIGIPGVLSVSGNRDTLEIQSKDIKFIKVDGKVYEIQRTTELKEVVDNYAYKGEIYFPQPRTIYNDGYGLAAPAIVPLVDTAVWYQAKTIDTLIVQSWNLSGSKSNNYLVGKPLKPKPRNKPKIYSIPEFIGKSESCGLFDKKRFEYVEQDRKAYKNALMKKYKISAAKAAEESDKRFGIITLKR